MRLQPDRAQLILKHQPQRHIADASKPALSATDMKAPLTTHASGRCPPPSAPPHASPCPRAPLHPLQLPPVPLLWTTTGVHLQLDRAAMEGPCPVSHSTPPTANWFHPPLCYALTPPCPTSSTGAAVFDRPLPTVPWMQGSSPVLHGATGPSWPAHLDGLGWNPAHRAQ
jgi:hypothetical protein